MIPCKINVSHAQRCDTSATFMLVLLYSRFLLTWDFMSSSLHQDKEQGIFPPAFKHHSSGFGKCVWGLH